MNKIVLISGKQGSGKSTLAAALVKRARDLGFQYVVVLKFADMLYELHDYLLNRMERATGKPRVVKDGPLLQWLGTEWGRNSFGKNVWVDILKQKIEKMGGSAELKRLIIIDDCRFENEFDAFPEALRVRLVCDENTRRRRCNAWRENTNHASETGLDNYHTKDLFDLYIDTSNSATVDPTEHSTSLIFSEIQRNSWKENRKPTMREQMI